MGLIGKFHDLPGCKTFYFRVRTPKGYTFDTAIVHFNNIHDAHSAVRLAYPGASIRALIEMELDTDGLPVIKPTIKREHERATNTGTAR